MVKHGGKDISKAYNSFVSKALARSTFGINPTRGLRPQDISG